MPKQYVTHWYDDCAAEAHTIAIMARRTMDRAIERRAVAQTAEERAFYQRRIDECRELIALQGEDPDA